MIPIPDLFFDETAILLVATQTTISGYTSTTYSGISGIPVRFLIDSESEAAMYGRNAELNSYTIEIKGNYPVKKTDVIICRGKSGDVVGCDVVHIKDIYTQIKAIEIA